MADADLVLEGGGVKGSGLVGAVSALAEHTDPYSIHRVAGTSAGAIVAGLLASGMSVAQVKAVMDGLDFARFEDESGFLAHLPGLGESAGLLFHEGLFTGGFLHDWISETLAGQGVYTWADLKEDDPGSALPPAHRYKLVVIVSDVSRGLMLRLPWDYEELLGLDPDKTSVADAIRASASIPFFFRPWKMPANTSVTGHDHIVCADGGLLSNFPMAIFDRHDGRPSRWPTLGVKLSGQTSIRTEDWAPDNSNIQLAKSLLSTMMGAHDRGYVNDPQAVARTIFVDTTNYRATDFHLTPADKEAMFTTGLASGQKFLSSWDWEAWKAGGYAR
ncbi:patatin-like phospholipase family protein [Arthrobacter sp. A2-55]|uniref:patatin-like phospholipase family protein n=1 Tax=Arthrobacter sp. A2-55 TaxID=2897337 RepID=UPI0021CD44DC|nr:patatin-like phospholipase family protein [Arthrobacter sp. A2-55]MCU6479264.1 patatin-like phospholipase family protein [Arthrobacter sp. A2-55]